MASKTKLKTLSFFVFLLSFSISQKGFSQNNLLGKWMDKEHKEKKIEMYLGGDKKIYGKSKSGTIVFKSLIFDSKAKIYSGILIDPANDAEFSIIINQPTADSFTFSVKKFIFSKKFTFIRLL